LGRCIGVKRFSNDVVAKGLVEMLIGAGNMLPLRNA